jgi:hypothetical protein
VHSLYKYPFVLFKKKTKKNNPSLKKEDLKKSTLVYSLQHSNKCVSWQEGVNIKLHHREVLFNNMPKKLEKTTIIIVATKKKV